MHSKWTTGAISAHKTEYKSTTISSNNGSLISTEPFKHEAKLVNAVAVDANCKWRLC